MDDNQETLDGLPPRQEATPSAPLAARYEILGELGRGGMGIVYKARDRETGEVLALKVLSPEIAADKAAMERFKNEVRLARKITHKNVCRIHDFYRAESTACISMEFVEGDSLRAILNRTGVSLRKGLEIARQICSGLGEAHAQDVVHRDLKPENVMLDRAGQVKVMDFGIARSSEGGLTQSGALVGTPAYMSPEQAEGKTADHRADIYALGLVLYEIFAGVTAFRGDTPFAVALKQIHETPPPPREHEPALPLHLEKAILRCLEKNPAKRFQSVAELEAALSEKAEEQPAAAVAEGQEIALPLHLTRWQRSDRWLLALAVVAAAGFFYLFDRTYPYPALEVRISRQEAWEKAQSLAQKFEPSAKATEVFPTISSRLGKYPLAVLVLGLPEANLRLKERRPGWYVGIDMGFRSGEAGRIVLDGDGKLEELFVPRRPGSHTDQPLVKEVILPVATRYVKELFGADSDASVPTVRTVPGNADRLELRWNLPGVNPDTEHRFVLTFSPEGLRRASQELFSKKEQQLQRSAEWEAAGQNKRWAHSPMYVLLVVAVLALLIVLTVILFFIRRLYATTSPSAFLIAVCAVLAQAGTALPIFAQDKPEFWKNTLPLFVGSVLGLLFYYVLLRVPEHYLKESLPTRAGTWLSLLSRRLKAQAAGLSLLRGCALGTCYLGAHTVVLIVLGGAKLAGPSIMWLELPVQRPELFAACIAILATIVAAWCLLAFPAALAFRTRRREMSLIAVPTLLWLLTSMFLPGASAFPLFAVFLFAGLQGLFFSYLLYRYDFLTMMTAVFTVETWLLVYPVYTIFHKAETLESSLGLLPWFSLLLLGLTLYFRPQIEAGWRGVKAVF